MPSICELKIALKAKGIKGITGLNKAGLERLLSGGKTETKKEAKKEEPKPKPFTPAPTKGESPKVAEKPINKKIKAPKMLMITYKEPKNEPKKEEPKKAVKPEKVPILNELKTIMLNNDKDDINELLNSMGFQGYRIKGKTETARKSAFNMLKKSYISTDPKVRRFSIEEFLLRFNKENCVDLMCKYGINSKAEYKEWVLKNHPDKGGTINVDDFNQIVACANKNSFCKK